MKKESNATTWDDLPTEIISYFASLLLEDGKSLSFFSQSSKSNAVVSLPVLNQLKKILTNRISFVMSDLAVICYTPEALYVSRDNRFNQLELNKEKIIFDTFFHVPETTFLEAPGFGNNGATITDFAQVPLELDIGEILEIASSGFHCMVLAAKGLYSCGQNNNGQLGLGDKSDRNTFTQIIFDEDIGQIKQLVVDKNISVLLTEKGLYVCGSSPNGALGFGDTLELNKFTRIPLDVDIGTILTVATSGEYTLLLTDKGLFACGLNNKGQLGLGDNQNRRIFTRVPLPEDIGEIMQVLVTPFNSTLLLAEKGLFVCGKNTNEAFGLGKVKKCNRFTQVPFDKNAAIEKVFFNLKTTILFCNNDLYVSGRIKGRGFGLDFFSELERINSFTKLSTEKIGKIWQVFVGDEATLILTDKGLYSCDCHHFNKCKDISFTKIESIKEVNVLHKLESYISTLEKSMVTCEEKSTCLIS
jgi:alpha-tubulin suppressor-like RCC1 family protein